MSMINWKGGVGKTTTTLHLGIGLKLFANKRVLLVDLDPQCNLSFLGLGVETYVTNVYNQGRSTLKTVFDSYFSDAESNAAEIIHGKLINSNPGRVYLDVDVVLSHQELVLLDLRLARSKKGGNDHKEDTRFEIEKLAILDRLLEQVRDDYDYVLLDCPPNVNFVTQNAFYTSDYYVVPAIPDFLSTTGISLIKDYMNRFNKDFEGMHAYAEMKKPYRRTEFGGIFFNMVDEYGGGPKKTHQEFMDLIETQHPGMTFNKYVTDGDGIAAAASLNLPVYSHQQLPRSNQNAQKQAEYFEELVKEFLVRIK